MPAEKPKMIAIVGPTATGKTDIAVELAGAINGEIISCDSMQVYKGMDIGTAKPPRETRKNIPHHLIDRLEVSEEYSAATFRTLALNEINRLCSRNKVPIIVGGSGLYVKALIDGLYPAPQADWGLRRKLYYEARKSGNDVLYERLRDVDQETASKLHPNDLRRVIRALEIYELTNTPPSKLKNRTDGIDGQYDIKMFGIMRRRSDIYERIDSRVDDMISAGLIEEVKALMPKGLSLTAQAALGYKEIMSHLKGEYDLDEAVRLIKRNTRRFAKRQITWFKSNQRLIWIEVEQGEKASEVAKKIEALIYV
ncbi:MAG: tRNA (adenosine(37)-N6)-dimethylallyltransferase MiaA [Candidatus Omnitrophica bacterium CG1_02_49_10]|nr:MAG: tRNA (adenosine(37)-N6)-dimethylallyltransferase MiaA [Candidatus Omnitrophica bacterium CG1_02_49_10]